MGLPSILKTSELNAAPAPTFSDNNEVQQQDNGETRGKRDVTFRLSARHKCVSDTKLVRDIQVGQGEERLYPVVNEKGEFRLESRSVAGSFFDSKRSDTSHTRRLNLNDAENEKLLRIAAAFLLDYEASRPATLYHDPEGVSSLHLYFHDIRFSKAWFVTLVGAAVCLCASCYFDVAPQSPNAGYDSWNKSLQAIFTFIPAALFYLDMAVMSFLRRPSIQSTDSNSHKFDEDSITPRTSRTRLWSIPLALSLLITCIETAVNLGRGERGIVWSSVLMPITFFYIFHEARDALDALIVIVPRTAYILCIQLFLIFSFACMACELYGSRSPASFGNLGVSFISLFECKG